MAKALTKNNKNTTLPKGAGIAIGVVVDLIFIAIIIFHHNPFAVPKEELIKKAIAVAMVLSALTAYIGFYEKIMSLPGELWANRELIWKLAKNDFKKRYAGSTMGRVWAFIQPVVTIAMYYFVFGLIFPARAQLAASGIAAPYVLWLTAGLIPWFYFSEALVGGMNALIEYNYLVKKVVFKISILPIIKVIAATFIHSFFVLVMLALYFFYGYKPSLYLIQVVYYSFCMFCLTLAISYSTCAVVVFFRDLSQIIGIGLQLGMWGTPILWEIGVIPEKFRIIFKLNPVFYIINGYRTAMFEKEWFFEDFYSTMFFWIITAIIFVIGALIFKRLKPHFADVL
ncbi:MAG: ABC transporter permease [Lachnospiraceae bacterium]|nr:ABC transporter permease [Lachnospiraceae bacterium]